MSIDRVFKLNFPSKCRTFFNQAQEPANTVLAFAFAVGKPPYEINIKSSERVGHMHETQQATYNGPRGGGGRWCSRAVDDRRLEELNQFIAGKNGGLAYRRNNQSRGEGRGVGSPSAAA
jgi:hypothetical protein